jgi:hypothetical protein
MHIDCCFSALLRVYVVIVDNDTLDIGNHEAAQYECGAGHKFGAAVYHRCWCGWTDAPADVIQRLGLIAPAPGAPPSL